VEVVDDGDGLLSWLRTRHQPVDLGSRAAAGDLAALRHIVGDASVIGIGEAIRGARSSRELRRLIDTVLRFAVEELDVRTVMLEGRVPDSAAAIDAYVRDGAGDPQEALRSAWAPWQTKEMVEVITWLRAFNASRLGRPVRVSAAVADNLGIAGHILRRLDDADHRILYWGGAAHSAVSSAHDTTFPPRTPSGLSDGAKLGASLGDRYLSIGCICDHAVRGDALPPPPAYFAETPLAQVETPWWYLDLRHPADAAAQSWLSKPTTTRLIGPHYDPRQDSQYCMSGSAFSTWFDAIIYVRETSPAQPLP
jgi:erythromycin esterase